MKNRKQHIFICCLATIFFSGSLRAQDDVLSYAREVVDTLCSPYMAGRGYVNEGDLKAATFIASQFKTIGLKNFQNNYFQNFTTSVNIFPGNVALTINGRALRPGEDFITDPCSPSLEGSFKTFSLPASVLTSEKKEHLENRLQKRKGKEVLVIDESLLAKRNKKPALYDNLRRIKSLPLNLAAILVLTEDKLIWSASPFQCAIPVLRVRKAAVHKKAKSLKITIESQLEEQYTTQNVIGYIPGRERPDSLIVFTAHYDHLGLMGANTIFPGANDNASGTAMLLSLARQFMQEETLPDYTLVFIAFSAEELFLRGSKHFVEQPLFPLKDIKLLVNIDMAGTGDEGITVVNGSIYEKYFKKLTRINDSANLLPDIRARGEACNSDHCYFHEYGIPSIFIYTRGGIQAYHDIHDKRETLPLTEFTDYLQLLTLFTRELMQ